MGRDVSVDEYANPLPRGNIKTIDYKLESPHL